MFQRIFTTKKSRKAPSSLLSLLLAEILLVTALSSCSRTVYSQPNQESEQITVRATNGILLCSDTDEILWEKDAETKIAPASCAKLVNALTVLKYCEVDEIITVGSEVNLIASDASRSYLYCGNELTVYQALIAMLLPSGNDAAYVLATYAGRKISLDPKLSYEKAIQLFMDQMNETALALGAENSFFCSPDGYDAKGQYSTAKDLAVIGEEVLENEELTKICGMAYSREVSGEVAEYYNTNELLLPYSDYYIEDCTGLKTGTSSDAGACLVMSFKVNGDNYIGVIMGSTKRMRFPDSLQLYQLIQ